MINNFFSDVNYIMSLFTANDISPEYRINEINILKAWFKFDNEYYQQKFTVKEFENDNFIVFLGQLFNDLLKRKDNDSQITRNILHDKMHEFITSEEFSPEIFMKNDTTRKGFKWYISADFTNTWRNENKRRDPENYLFITLIQRFPDILANYFEVVGGCVWLSLMLSKHSQIIMKNLLENLTGETQKKAIRYLFSIGVRVEELPQKFKEFLEEHFPEILTEPHETINLQTTPTNALDDIIYCNRIYEQFI